MKIIFFELNKREEREVVENSLVPAKERVRNLKTTVESKLNIAIKYKNKKKGEFE